MTLRYISCAHCVRGRMCNLPGRGRHTFARILMAPQGTRDQVRKDCGVNVDFLVGFKIQRQYIPHGYKVVIPKPETAKPDSSIIYTQYNPFT